MRCEPTQLKRVKVRWRMVDGTTQDVAVRAYADAGLTQKVAEMTIPAVLTAGTWYTLFFVIPSGGLYWRGWSPFYSAWFGSASGALDVANGTQLDIDLVSTGPWVASYTQIDPGVFTLYQPLPAPVVTFGDYGIGFFTAGEFGMTVDCVWTGPVDFGDEIRFLFETSAVGPESGESAWQTLIAGSQTFDFDHITTEEYFSISAWAEVRHVTGLTTIGARATLSFLRPTFVQDSALCWYRLANASPDSGSSPALTVVGGAFIVGGLYGGCYQSTGSVSKYLRTPAATFSLGSESGDYAVSLWTNPAEADRGLWSVGSANPGLRLSADFLVEVWSGGALVYTSQNPITQNVWNHVVLCRSSGVLSLYLNGALDGSISDTASLVSGYMRIGQYTASGTACHVGKIDEVAIWDRSLSGAEINALNVANGVMD